MQTSHGHLSRPLYLIAGPDSSKNIGDLKVIAAAEAHRQIHVHRGHVKALCMLPGVLIQGYDHGIANSSPFHCAHPAVKHAPWLGIIPIGDSYQHLILLGNLQEDSRLAHNDHLCRCSQWV